MATEISKEFIANEKTLVFYAGKPIIDKQHVFVDQCGGDYDFSIAQSFTFKIWEEREGGLLVISWSSPVNLSSSGNVLFLNAPPQDTDIEIGRYYYEICYLLPGGYEVLIAYGQAQFK